MDATGQEHNQINGTRFTTNSWSSLKLLIASRSLVHLRVVSICLAVLMPAIVKLWAPWAHQTRSKEQPSLISHMASISFGKSGIILEYSCIDCIDHSSGRNFEGRNQGTPSLEPFASLLSSFRWRYGEPIDATPAALLCMVLRCASIRKEEISRSATSQTRSVSRVGNCYILLSCPNQWTFSSLLWSRSERCSCLVCPPPEKACDDIETNLPAGHGTGESRQEFKMSKYIKVILKLY